MLQRTATPSASRPTEPGPAQSLPDAVRIRNCDHLDGHSVRVTMTQSQADRAHTDRCFLAPGQSRQLLGSVDPGRYHMAVEIDGLERSRHIFRFDGTASGTAVIEVGNGVVSVRSGAAQLVDS